MENKITNAGALHLSYASWRNLQIFDLSANLITDLGVVHLSRANWPNLEELRLGKNKITDEKALYLSFANRPKLEAFLFNYQAVKVLQLYELDLSIKGGKFQQLKTVRKDIKNIRILKKYDHLKNEITRRNNEYDRLKNEITRNENEISRLKNEAPTA